MSKNNILLTDCNPRSLSSYFKSAFLFLFMSIFMVGVVTPTNHAYANAKYASIIMEVSTGEVLYSRSADKRLHPASMTKAMTLLLTFEALEKGKLSLNDRVKISRRAASMVPSKLGLRPGQTIRVKDAIYILVTKSANDVAVAMAEHMGRTESNFAQRMTNKARAIGMKNTTFKNASGLYSKNQKSTARDMAIMAKYIINVYPSYYTYFSRRNYTYKGKTYRNHNRLMETYKGMDGLKTGYIGAAGFNLVASAKRGDRRLIGVVFGGRSSRTRNAHMASLLDKGFKTKPKIRVAKQIVTPRSVPAPKRKPITNETVAGAPRVRSFDASSKRIESGQMAIIAHLSSGHIHDDYVTKAQSGIQPAGGVASNTHSPFLTNVKPAIVPVSYTLDQPVNINSDAPWSVQVGAFKTRDVSNQVIQEALKALPASLKQGQPMIAPLQTNNGWLFRARLSGFTKSEALEACNYIRDCLPVAPR